MIIDRLYEEVEKKSFVCVGLDTDYDAIPHRFKSDVLPGEAIFRFNKEIIEHTHDLAAVYKLQIAYYEALGLDGLRAYAKTLRYLQGRKLLSIGDIKRSDIAATAKMYARAHFETDFRADFITLNPYMGYDSIEPYLPYLESGKKGVFVLLRTSNPGAKDIEYLEHKGRHLYYQIGDGLAQMGKAFTGKSGYSSLGLVVGGTHSEEAKEIREQYRNSFFLIPGYGAQGGKAEDIRNYLNDFNGGVVNSSRGIINHWKNFEDGERKVGEYARLATLKMVEDIRG